MVQKLQKAKKSSQRPHPRNPRSLKYETWKSNIATGMREAKLKRREAGLFTLTEVAVELGLSKRAAAEIFPVIVAGARKFIQRSEVERWKAGAGADGV
jgi:hypothetical protein